MSYSRAKYRMAYPGGGFSALNGTGNPPSLAPGVRPQTTEQQYKTQGRAGFQQGVGVGSVGAIPPGGPPGGPPTSAGRPNQPVPGIQPGSGLPGGPPTRVGRPNQPVPGVQPGSGPPGAAPPSVAGRPNQPVPGVQLGSGPPGAAPPSVAGRLNQPVPGVQPRSGPPGAALPSLPGRTNQPPMANSRLVNVPPATGNQVPGQRMQPTGYSSAPPPGRPGTQGQQSSYESVPTSYVPPGGANKMMGGIPIGSAAAVPTPPQGGAPRALPHQSMATGAPMPPGAAVPVSGYGADGMRRNLPGPVSGSGQSAPPPPPGTHPSDGAPKTFPGQVAPRPSGRPGSGPPPLHSKPPSTFSPSGANPPQFFSVASGKPTPVASSGPPTAVDPGGLSGPPTMPLGASPMPSAPGPPTAQFQQMSLGPGPPPQGSQVPPPLAMPGMQGPAAPQANFYPTTQAGVSTGYPGAPGPGLTRAPSQLNAAGVPAIQQLDSQLPTLQDVDINIQADKRYMQLSTSEVPNSSSAAQYSKLPLCCVVQPMALDNDKPDGGIPLVDLGVQGIVRCKRCRIYMNPFVSWINNGRQWRCNACGMVNDVPASYFCHLDDKGYRRDRDQRPELSCGSVEFVAPSEYMVRPPVAPVYCFCLDVSAQAVSSGMLATAIATIKGCLDNLQGGERTQVGFITFDKSIHFYNLKSTLQQPQMLVVSDVMDFLLPCPEDLLVNLSESRAVVDALLDVLPTMFANNRSVDIALGPAINASAMVMQHIGGKLCVFCSGLPSLGEGKLKLRENPRLLGTDQEHKLLKPDDKYFEDKAIELSKYQICVELFLFNRQYQDVATLSQLPSKTAGGCYFYPAFAAARAGEKFSNELARVLTRPTAFEAVMRIRTTRGIRSTNFHGNYFIRGNDLLLLPNCSPDSVFVIQLCVEDTVLSSDFVSMQTALLYTTSGGERRIRVHNIAVPVQAALPQVINSANIDIVSNLIAKRAADIAVRLGLDAARANLQQCCVDMLRASRGGGYGPSGRSTMGGQESLAIPESIQLLPLFCMSLVKNVCFRGGADISSDVRSYMINLLNNMPVSHSRCFIYPRMFSLHNMPQDAGLPLSQPSESTPTAGKKNVKLPPIVTLSAESLTTDGIYILENAVYLQLWVGRGVDPNMLQPLLGVPNLGGIDTSTVSILRHGDSKSFVGRVCAIVDALREERISWLQVHVTGEGDGQNEYKFMQNLVEDRANFPGGGANYPEWMQLVQRQSFGGI